MKKFTEKNNSISGLMALLVFGIFAVCILLVLLQGAATYEKIHEKGQLAYGQRTAAHFLSTKIRQADGPVRVVSFGDGDALVFEEPIDGDAYATWIYCYDGWLREYFGTTEEEPLPEFGELILEAGYLSMSLEDNLLWILLEDSEGEDQELQLYLRSGGEAYHEE